MKNAKMTNKEVKAMSTSELREALVELQVIVESAPDDKMASIAKGSIGLIEVELAKRPAETKDGDIVVEADGSVTEIIDNTDKTEETDKPEDKDDWSYEQPITGTPSPEQSEYERKASEEMFEIINTIISNNELDVNSKWSKILKAASERADETKLPAEECSDSELLRRLKLVWSKKVAAKKAANFVLLAELEAEEAMLNSYRNTSKSRTGTVSSDVKPEDLGKMTQEDLRKLIRNYQSKKSSAKKANDPTMEAHWQSKVEEAQKHLKDAPNKPSSAELVNTSKSLLESLKPLAGTSAEVDAMIAKLEAVVQ